MNIRFDKENSASDSKTSNGEHPGEVHSITFEFSETDGISIAEYNDKMNCSYSGLPSIYAYAE